MSVTMTKPSTSRLTSLYVILRISPSWNSFSLTLTMRFLILGASKLDVCTFHGDPSSNPVTYCLVWCSPEDFHVHLEGVHVFNLNGNQVFILRGLWRGNLITVRVSIFNFVHHKRKRTPVIRFVTHAFILDTRGIFRKGFFTSPTIWSLGINLSGQYSLFHSLMQHLNKGGMILVLKFNCLMLCRSEGCGHVDFETWAGIMFRVVLCFLFWVSCSSTHGRFWVSDSVPSCFHVLSIMQELEDSSISHSPSWHNTWKSPGHSSSSRTTIFDAIQHCSWCRMRASCSWICGFLKACCLKFHTVNSPVKAWNSWMAFPKMCQANLLFEGIATAPEHPKHKSISIGDINRTPCLDSIDGINSPRIPNLLRDSIERFCWSPYLAIELPDDNFWWFWLTNLLLMGGFFGFDLMLWHQSHIVEQFIVTFVKVQGLQKLPWNWSKTITHHSTYVLRNKIGDAHHFGTNTSINAVAVDRNNNTSVPVRRVHLFHSNHITSDDDVSPVFQVTFQ